MLEETAAATGTAVSGVGISVAGFLDPVRESMIGNANLTALCGFPLRRALEERLALDCRLEVDSNAAVVAEYRYGAGREAGRLLGVTVGTGLGGGVMIGGRLLRFNGECAGDIGHIILDPTGRRCSCGMQGCLEALVCSAAVSDRGGGRRIRDLIGSARRGEPSAIDALAATGWWLGMGLASLSPIFAPDTIVVGGGIGAAGDLLMEPTRASYRAHATQASAEGVRIVGSSFEGWEGLVGAASLFLDPID
jgi:glucokinase